MPGDTFSYFNFPKIIMTSCTVGEKPKCVPAALLLYCPHSFSLQSECDIDGDSLSLYFDTVDLLFMFKFMSAFYHSPWLVL